MWFSKRGHEHESRICNYVVYFMLLKRHFLHIYGSACLPHILCNLKTFFFFIAVILGHTNEHVYSKDIVSDISNAYD